MTQSIVGQQAQAEPARHIAAARLTQRNLTPLVASGVAFVLITGVVPFVAQLIRGNGGLLPEGEAIDWDPPILALHVVSDTFIGLAYVAISIMLLHFARKAGRAVPFLWAFLAFGTFIVACGLTHFAAALTIWAPLYWLAGGFKYVTVVASIGTAIALPARPRADHRDTHPPAERARIRSMRRAPRAHSGGGGPASPQSGKPLVLVVDDDAIREALELGGYPTAQAANGQEALAIMSVALPALVLLDMRMLVMDGWTFAAKLRARRMRTQVCVLTATTNARQWAEEIGAVGYLGKPFGVDEVLAVVQRLCGSGGHGPSAANP